MQDFVRHWIACGVVLWTAAFLVVRKALPHRSFDFCNRLVSTMHASTAVCLAALSVQDWSCPVCPLGARSSPWQVRPSLHVPCRTPLFWGRALLYCYAQEQNNTKSNKTKMAGF